MDSNGAISLSGSQNEVFSVVEFTEQHLSRPVNGSQSTGSLSE